MSNEHEEQISPKNLWNSSEAAEHWQQDVKRRQQDMAEATQLMLEAAGLKPADHVLDIAAGTGDQSLLAARIVGSNGSVLATDISPEMLNIAARLAQQEGLTNVTTRVMDAEQLDLEDNAFDAVICRLGLMLMPHPQQAMREIRRVLKPGGKLAALVWSNNPLFSLSLTIMAKHMQDTSIPASNPFTLADPAVFERELTGAGFHDVMTRPIPFHSHYASLEAFLQSSGKRIMADVVGQLSQPDQQHLLDEVKQALSQFEGPQGLVAPAEMLLGVATR